MEVNATVNNPRMTKNGSKRQLKIQRNISITPADWMMIGDLAEEEGVSRSEYVAMMAKGYLQIGQLAEEEGVSRSEYVAMMAKGYQSL